MATVTSKVDENLDRAHPNHVKVFSHDVAKAVNKLNKGKRDGHGDFYSDHLINASPKLFTVLAMLINCMIMHGYSPSKLLESTIVPIPKDNRASLTCSENYIAIALCNSICKLVDIILIEQYSDALYTSDLQFGFKKNHSTLIYTTVLLETVSYFTERNYDVYACLLDASKAFDRVHYGKLFDLLMQRNIPAIVVRYLIDNYCRQQMSVQWNGHYSDQFEVHNGVKQGGVLSPILFAIYIDELLIKLKKSSLGCYIGDTFIGALGYADDITLISPSVKGLNEMIKNCESFAEQYYITFNERKTVAVKFGNNSNSECHIILNGQRVPWKDETKQLGNIISCDMSDAKDCIYKRSQFIGSVNKLLGNYEHIPNDVLCRLFSIYCSFYGSQLWGCASEGFSRCVTEWNKAVRRVLHVSNCTHRWMLGPLSGQVNITEQLHVMTIQSIFTIL